MGARGSSMWLLGKGTVSRTLGILLLLACFAAPVAANGLVRGDGFRFRVPPELQTSPSAKSQALRHEMETLVSGSALPVSGAPDFRCRVNKGDGVQLGTLVSLCYRLPAGTGITDVAQIEGERLQLGLEAIDPDRNRPQPRIKQREIGRQRIGLEVQLNSAGAPGEIWCVLAVENDHLLLLAYQRELPSDSDAAWWGATLSSIHLEQHGAQVGLTNTILGAGALIALLLLWLTIRLVRHRRSLGPMGGSIIMAGGASGIRAADGLALDQDSLSDSALDLGGETPEQEQEEEEPEEAPYPFRFGLPPLEEATPAPAPAPEGSVPEPPRREPEPAIAAPPSKAEAAPEPQKEAPAKPAPIRIQRNNDFVS